jgi:hypothetical protein
MSFYGSVYYQLIDTFYKVIVKNNGDKNYDFNKKLVNPSGTLADDVVESPATGRKGIFSLDSGNYWINFSKNENDTKEAAPYKIWHSPAHNDSKTMKRVSSWDIKTSEYESEFDDYGIETKFYRKDDPEKTDLRGTDHYIQLEEHDMLKLYESNYDEAGHVIQDQTKEVLYRLPKTSVNENVNWLMNLVGKPNVDLPRWDVPVEEQKGEQTSANSILTLTDYAEKNYEDIKTLEDYVGDWDDVSYYGTKWGSIADVFGDLTDLFGDYNSFNKNKNELSIFKIIGKLPKLWKEFNEDEEPVSLVETILEITKNLNNFSKETKDTLNTHTQLLTDIGSDTENRGHIYPAINNLYHSLEITTTEINERIDQEVEDLNERINAEVKDLEDTDSVLQKNINNEEEERKKSDNTLQSNIETETSNREKADEILQSNIDAEKTAREQALNNLNT